MYFGSCTYIFKRLSKKHKTTNSSVSSAVSEKGNKESTQPSENVTVSDSEPDAAVFSEESAVTAAGEIRYCLYTPKNPQKICRL